VISDEKIKQIRKRLIRGYPQGELTNELLAEGYSGEEIQEAYFSLYPKTQTADNSSSFPLWYVLCVGIVILLMAIFAVEYRMIRYYKYVFPALGMFSIAASSLADKFVKK